MRVHARLVLGEEDGVAHLPDVVIKGAGTYQLGVGADLGGRLGSEDGYLQGVLERARASLAKLLQDRVVDVGQFHQRDAGHVSERLLQHIYQYVGEHDEDEVDAEIEHHHPVDLIQVRLLEQREAHVADGVREEDEECAPDQLRTFAQVSQAERHDHARYGL